MVKTELPPSPQSSLAFLGCSAQGHPSAVLGAIFHFFTPAVLLSPPPPPSPFIDRHRHLPGRAGTLPSSPFSPLSRPLFSRSPPSASLGPLAALGACSLSLGCQTLRFHIIVPQETWPLHSSPPLRLSSSSLLLPSTQRS